MWWLLLLIPLIVLALVFMSGPGRSMTKRVLTIQDICSKNYWNFDLYVNTSTDFSLDDAPSKDSLKIMFESPFGLRSKYLTYHGSLPIEIALDELIAHFQK